MKQSSQNLICVSSESQVLLPSSDSLAVGERASQQGVAGERAAQGVVEMAGPQEVVERGWAGDQEEEVGWAQGPGDLGAGHHTRLQQQQFVRSMQRFGG